MPGDSLQVGASPRETMVQLEGPISHAEVLGLNQKVLYPFRVHGLHDPGLPYLAVTGGNFD